MFYMAPYGAMGCFSVPVSLTCNPDTLLVRGGFYAEAGSEF